MSDSALGRVWLLQLDDTTIGYAAVCFGYSIEFGGRDGFLDELYLIAEHRGRGLGGAALELLRTEAARLGLRALSLEVARDNEPAKRLYRGAGFVSRERYCRMTARLAEERGEPPDADAP